MAIWPVGAQTASLPTKSEVKQLADAKVSDSDGFSGLKYIIAETLTDIESVVILKNGHIVFEYYKKGSGPTTLRDIQSVTKSVLSTLVGIATAQGCISNLDQPITDFIPELAIKNSDPRAQKISIRNLLTMTSGFEIVEHVDKANRDSVLFSVSRAISAMPGKTFSYDNLSADLLSIVLERATSQDTDSFAKLHLFKPLGIHASNWRHGSHGHTYGSGGLRLRTRDMAKLGQLYFKLGLWNDQQVVPKNFIREAVKIQNSKALSDTTTYGYMWWVAPLFNTSNHVFFAHGYGGQFVWVSPSLEIVVAATSAVSEASDLRGHARTLIEEYIVSALTKN